MAGTAQGTVDSLLGRLSSVLLEEAQLLRGVRGDVRFIRDEMEIMNGFLLDLANVDNPNNQVQAWTRQVRDLATDSQNCIDRYVQSLGARPIAAAGFLGFLRRVPHLARTMPTRHRIATQIRELKSRARELGERRLRYGIKAPPPDLDTKAPTPAVGDGTEHEEEEEGRRASADVTRRILDEDAREVIRWLTEDPRHRRLRVIAITRTLYQETELSLAQRVFDHPCTSSWFDCKAWIEGVRKTASRMEILQQVLKQLARAAADNKQEPMATASGDEQQLVEKIKDHLRGKRILIVAANDPFGLVRKEIESACVPADAADDDGGICSPGSAIIVTARRFWEHPESFVPYQSKDYTSPALFRGNANELVGSVDEDKTKLIERILRICSGDFFCTEMFLRALYVNPNRTKVELPNLLNSLRVIGGKFFRHFTNLTHWVKARKMVEFCYNGLPSHHKSCLLYLSIYPRDFEIRRTSLVRRWAAENLITKRDGMSEADESERCFNALVALGLVRPVNIGAAGNVKSCKVHPHVLSFVAKEVNASNKGQQPELAHRLPIHSGIQLQKRSKEDANAAEPPNTRKNIPRRMQTLLNICQCLTAKGSKAPSNSTETLFESLQASSLSGLVKVLDLEGCEGLNKSHLKYICNNISLLRYLSLRKTGVDKLPKEIDKLQCLETLDIRQTNVRALATRYIVLRKLKHLLAGTVLQMPRGIRHMTDLQILSRVKVSNSEEELMDVGELHQLRKLGVVLSGEDALLRHLFQVITKLNECLCSLSLSVPVLDEDKPPHDLYPEEAKGTFSSPRSLVSLSINGRISGLPAWISELHRLSKITLRGTRLTDTNALCILGRLDNLHCLRLRDKSYMESTLTFIKEEFQSLKFLLVEGSEIHNIQFDDEAAPKLEKITWSFAEMPAPPSGVKILPCLKVIGNHPCLEEIELSSNWDRSRVRELISEIAAHPKYPVVITPCHP